PLAEPGLQHLAIAGLGGHMNIWRCDAELIELLQTGVDPLGAGRAGDRLFGVDSRPEIDALDHASASHLECLEHDACWTTLKTEHVSVTELCGGHLLLTIVEGLDGADGIAQLRRLFETLGIRGREHPALECPDQLLVPAFEEQLRESYRAAVLGGRTYGVDAGRQTSFDVVLQARPLAFAGDDLVAGAHAEQLVRERHGLPGEVRRQEGPGVKAAVPLDAPRDQHARKRLVGRELKVRVALVVAQQDVVFGRSLFDQVVLERQGLANRIGQDDFRVGARGLLQERIGLRVGAVCPQVVAPAVAQRTRLAHVDGVAVRVEVEIDARLLRPPSDLLLDFLDGHTLLCRGFRLFLTPPLYAGPRRDRIWIALQLHRTASRLLDPRS